MALTAKRPARTNNQTLRFLNSNSDGPFRQSVYATQSNEILDRKSSQLDGGNDRSVSYTLSISDDNKQQQKRFIGGYRPQTTYPRSVPAGLPARRDLPRVQPRAVLVRTDDPEIYQTTPQVTNGQVVAYQDDQSLIDVEVVSEQENFHMNGSNESYVFEPVVSSIRKEEVCYDPTAPNSSLPNLVSNSTRSFDIAYEYDSENKYTSVNHFDDNRHAALRRSVSDEGCYPAEMCVEQASFVPLDLSVKSGKLSNVPDAPVPPMPLSHSVALHTGPSLAVQQPSLPPPKMSLLHLADAVTYFIENDPQSSEAFHSCNSSPPSSICDSNSTYSMSSEEKPAVHEGVFTNDSEEYLSVSPEPSLDGCLIKCEMGDSFRPDEGIVLNSNVVGENVYCDRGSYHSADNVDSFCHENDVLSSVENYSINEENGENMYSCSSSPTYLEDQSSIKDEDDGGFVTPDEGWKCSSAIDSKRRLRLAKSEYESMSEEDRRVRHRVLDNQRSKQYRERRRRMVNTLQQEIGILECDNRSLKESARSLERRLKLMRLTIQRTNPTCSVSSNMRNQMFLKAEC